MFYNWLLISKAENATIAVICITLLLVLVIIILLVVFVGRKNSLVKEQQEAKEEFEKELAESQIEIRETTLRNISWELHDNIGQLLTLAKIQAQNVKDHPEQIDEVVETIGTGLNELRTLSKLINPDVLKNQSIADAVQLEIDRFNRLEFIESSLSVVGEVVAIDPSAEIFLFRILQEFFSNTIKHSKATRLEVSIHYGDVLHLKAKDNGIGFESTIDASGIGLQNIKNRANLIGAHLEISSQKNKGTTLTLTYNYKQIPSHEKA